MAKSAAVQARRMIEDIEVVGAAFADALAETSESQHRHHTEPQLCPKNATCAGTAHD